MKKKCLVIGAGGHAKVVIDILLMEGICSPCGIVTKESPKTRNSKLLDIPILGDDSILSRLKGKGMKNFIVGVGAVGDNRGRKDIFDRMKNQGFQAVSTIHPRAIVADSAKIKSGTVVMAGGIINAGTIVGNNCIINTGAIVDHDCVIADHVHIAPGAVLSGGVEVGLGAHIGTGATVKQGVKIGSWAVLAAGAVVVKDVPAGVVVAGVPAGPMRNS